MKMFTVTEIIDAYNFDIEMLREDKKNSNRSKLIQRDNLMLQFLATLPEDMKISAEATPTGYAKINAGSLTEIILDYHITKSGAKYLEKASGKYDTKRGCIGVEIKLSINGSCYNTPIKERSLVYLVNRDGVFMIRKDDLDELAPKGKLPFKACEKMTLIKSLTRALGYEIK
jgi:hypothetical protein